ncbi:Fur family transcriptional regulator [Clostridium sp.]|uniref:Fur family transcriptional regulator n=1 Tax=Clostridium sp. TaxID=1506 RepID=UPI002620D0A8|nr:Fur family transcriptional regulator [Clostridium sp.]
MEPIEILKENGIKITKGRTEILNILIISKSSLSAEKIYNIFRDNNININLSTIYRTLELFEEKEITEKITLNDGVFSYKLKSNTHRHYLECHICHKEVEIPCPMLQIEEMVQNTTGFTLTDHNLIMKGICKDCKKKK